jgi:DNA invertase Pin-like site-specific DNA recombinase
MKSESAKKRGIIYARAARMDSESIRYQILMCEERMKKDNVEAVHVPVIDVVSGKNDQKTELEELQKLVKSKSIDYLYVSTSDRLGREPAKILQLLQRLENAGITLRTIDKEVKLGDILGNGAKNI